MVDVVVEVKIFSLKIICIQLDKLLIIKGYLFKLKKSFTFALSSFQRANQVYHFIIIIVG